MGAYTSQEYSGDNHCAYNMARALLFSKQWHESYISHDPKKWAWGNQNHKEYQNLPWSKIPGLNKFFHRSVPASGSTETPNMSKIREKDWDQVYIQSMSSANFKFISQIAKDPKDDVTLYSIDTGMNGNPFQGHYFDMNEKHLKGELMQMKWTKEKLEGTPVKTLVLKPKQAQKDQKSAADEL